VIELEERKDVKMTTRKMRSEEQTAELILAVEVYKEPYEKAIQRMNEMRGNHCEKGEVVD
jgi:hypothetical protein